MNDQDDYVDDDLDHIDTQSDFFYNIDPVESSRESGQCDHELLLPILGTHFFAAFSALNPYAREP